jgi:hypothetical protein
LSRAFTSSDSGIGSATADPDPQKVTLSQFTEKCPRCDVEPAWSPFSDPHLTRQYRIAAVRRLIENARRQLHSGIWLSVDEIEAMLSVIPAVTFTLTPRQTEEQ